MIKNIIFWGFIWLFGLCAIYFSAVAVLWASLLCFGAMCTLEFIFYKFLNKKPNGEHYEDDGGD